MDQITICYISSFFHIFFFFFVDAFAELFSRLLQIRQKEPFCRFPSENCYGFNSLHFFGFAVPPVAAALEKLSDVYLCDNYRFKFRDPPEMHKSLYIDLRHAAASQEGCARSRPFHHSHTKGLARAMAVRASEEENETVVKVKKDSDSSNAFNALPMAMRYRQMKGVPVNEVLEVSTL